MTSRSATTRTAGRPRAVTLTEMLVVLAVVVALLGLAIPALSVWEERKRTDAINQCSGLLKGAQARARSRLRPAGLFFYVDPETGAQSILPIRPDLDPYAPDETAERFRIEDAVPFRLPRPIRVAPTTGLDPALWSEQQLADDDLRRVDGDGAPDPPYDGTLASGAQFHRNFFVVVFDRSGAVLPAQRAFIHDPDHPGQEQDGLHPGVRSGLTISGHDHALAVNAVIAEGPEDAAPPLLFGAATGLLIYDGESFDLQSGERREFLRLGADPLYIHRRTGRILLGERASRS